MTNPPIAKIRGEWIEIEFLSKAHSLGLSIPG